MGAILGEGFKGGFLEKEVIWTESLRREEIACERKSKSLETGKEGTQWTPAELSLSSWEQGEEAVGRKLDCPCLESGLSAILFPIYCEQQRLCLQPGVKGSRDGGDLVIGEK